MDIKTFEKIFNKDNKNDELTESELFVVYDYIEIAGIESLRDALKKIARNPCENYTSGFCYKNGRIENTEDGANAVCNPCIAKKALEEAHTCPDCGVTVDNKEDAKPCGGEPFDRRKDYE